MTAKKQKIAIFAMAKTQLHHDSVIALNFEDY